MSAPGANPPRYVRIPGRGYARGTLFLRLARLYAGDDHLLLVENSGFSEDYRRFAYRDVQALVVVRSNRFWGWLLALSLPTLAFGLPSAFSWEGFGAAAGWVATLLFAIPLLVHVLRGPTCRATLFTAVQRVELGSLGRVRAVARAFPEIRRRVEAAQGAAAPDLDAAVLFSERLGATAAPEYAPGSARAAVTPGARGAETPAADRTPPASRFHVLLFAWLLVEGVTCALVSEIAGRVPTALAATLVLASCAFVVAAFSEQRKATPGPLRAATWLAAAAVGGRPIWGLASWYVDLFSASVRQGVPPTLDLVPVTPVTIGLSLAAGVLGLVAFEATRERPARDVPPLAGGE